MPFIAAGHASDLDGLSKEIGIYKTKAPNHPLCLGFITFSSVPRLADVLAQYKPLAVQFTAPGVMEDHSNIKIARDAGVKFIFAQVVPSIVVASTPVACGVGVCCYLGDGVFSWAG